MGVGLPKTPPSRWELGVGRRKEEKEEEEEEEEERSIFWVLSGERGARRGKKGED